MNEHKYWDLGEHETIRPSKASLSKILDAVIRLGGKIHSTYCMELDWSTREYRYPTNSCSVLFRISLPEGNEAKFETLTGFKLTPPPNIGVNQDSYDLNMTEMYDLVDGFNQYKAEMEEMRSAWRNYVDYLREKYPQPDGEFLFKCPHHHRINEVLKCTP